MVTKLAASIGDLLSSVAEPAGVKSVEARSVVQYQEARTCRALGQSCQLFVE